MRIVLDSYNIATAERLLVVEALTTAGSIVEAAQLLGVTRQQVKRLIIKHQLMWPRAPDAPRS